MSRIAFLGSPQVAADVLTALLDAGHDVALAVTAPDRRRGRGGARSPTPVKRVALDRGVEVADRADDVLEVRPPVELGVVVAFGQLLRRPLIDEVPLVNVHFSLLPRWRGAAPVERAILAGDERTGVCLMRIEEGLDTGPVYECRSLEIAPHETAAKLTGRLGALGAGLLVERLGAGLGSLGEPSPQVGETTYAAKLAPDELQIDWSLGSEAIERVVRLGRAWTTWRGKRLRIESARAEPDGALAGSAPPGALRPPGLVVAGEGVLRLEVVRPEGRGAVDAEAWWRGARVSEGERLGD